MSYFSGKTWAAAAILVMVTQTVNGLAAGPRGKISGGGMSGRSMGMSRGGGVPGGGRSFQSGPMQKFSANRSFGSNSGSTFRPRPSGDLNKRQSGLGGLTKAGRLNPINRGDLNTVIKPGNGGILGPQRTPFPGRPNTTPILNPQKIDSVLGGTKVSGNPSHGGGHHGHHHHGHHHHGHHHHGHHHHHWWGHHWPLPYPYPVCHSQPYCGTVYVDGAWTYCSQPVAYESVSVIPLVVGEKLPEIPSGATFKLPMANLGANEGAAVVQIRGMGMATEVLQWNPDAAVLRLPAVGLTEPTLSELTVVRTDGTVAHTMKFHMLPALEPALAAN